MLVAVVITTVVAPYLLTWSVPRVKAEAAAAAAARRRLSSAAAEQSPLRAACPTVAVRAPAV